MSKYKCDECDFTCNTLTELDNHVDDVHDMPVELL